MIAQSRAYETCRITIGTEDEEYLRNRAQNQAGMPSRFVDEQTLTPQTIEYLEDGIRIQLPTFLSGEEGQVQFVIAWSEGVDREDVATWYAVDVPYEEILRYAMKSKTDGL